MDLLQVALILLIFLLAIFLSITGFYVFLILRDLKKALDRLNHVLQSGEEMVQEVEKPVASVSSLVNALSGGVKSLVEKDKKDSKQQKKRFYKKVL